MLLYLVIWIDDIDTDGDEPKYIGEFNSVDELLEKFTVDGELFVTSILPNITNMNRLLTG